MIEIALYRRELDEARERRCNSSPTSRKGIRAIDHEFQAAGLIDLNLQMASERDPRVMLEKVCNGARALLDARYAVLLVNEKFAKSPFCATSGLELPDGEAREPCLARRGPLGRVYGQRSAWRAHTQPNEPPIPVFPDGYPCRARTCRSRQFSGSTYGWLCLATSWGEEFTHDDERILAILAGQSGRIYENGSLYMTCSCTPRNCKWKWMSASASPRTCGAARNGFVSSPRTFRMSFSSCPPT